MGAWVKQNRKALSLGLGALLLVVGVAMLFWSYGDSGMTEEERRAAANVARMEARIQAQLGGVPDKAPDKPLFGEELKEKQQMQLRIVVIAMLVFGAGFMAYGLLKKEE